MRVNYRNDNQNATMIQWKKVFKTILHLADLISL